MAGVVQRPVSLGSQVADILRQRIVRGELKPGERLTEEALAEEFNVSRGPIRDAITQLNFEKLVQVQRPRGVYIMGLTDDDVEQLYSLRAALEQLALRRAVRVEEDARWHPLRECVERMRRAADDRDPAEFARADLEFHSDIYDLADHPRLQAAWQQYMPTFAALLEVTINHDEDLHESAEDHLRLYEVMRSGDITDAALVLDEHLAGAKERMSLELAARRA
jgi:DNA-binding GntR family transcriptional regulator